MKKLFIFLWFYFFIWLACPLISQTQGVISDATIIPPNYLTFAGPEKAGDSYVDPVFGTIVKRMTDSGKSAPNGNGGEIPNSEIAYFNSNDTYFMVSENVLVNGDYQGASVLYDGQSGKFVKVLGYDSLRPWWCRWAIANKYKKDGKYVQFEPSQHFYKYEGNEIRLYNVQNSTYVLLHKFNEYNAIGPAGGEGDLSLDGRYWLLDGDGRELFLYDLIDDVKHSPSRFDLGNVGSQGNEVGVDYAAVSALGNYILVSWSYEASEARYHGLELYDKNWNFLRQLHPEIGHWVRGIDAFGDEVVYCVAGFGVQEFWQRQNVDPGDYVSIRLKDGYIRQLIDMPVWVRHLSSAVSMQKNPNYIYVAFRTRSEDPDQLWAPYWGEIVEVPTDGSQAVRRLVHHRTRKIESQSQKFYQPDFNINHAGTKIIYRSSYTHNYCDLYMFDVIPRNGNNADTILPNAPTGLTSPEQTYASITLKWQAPAAAADGDVAAFYRIYRDGQMLSQVYQVTFIDANLSEGQSYQYDIYSVDKAGNQSRNSAGGIFSTLADQTAPIITQVQALNADKILISFSEPIEQTSAEMTGHYLIEPSVPIEKAELLSDTITVSLTTQLTPGTIYRLTVLGVRDRSRAGNFVDPNNAFTFQSFDGITDDFESGSMMAWQPWHSERWEIRPDAGDLALYVGVQDYESPGGQRLGEYARYKTVPFVASDFELTCWAKSAENLGQNRYADYALVFGYQDTLNYYYVQFHSYDVLACQISDGQRVLLKKVDVPQSWNDYTRLDLQLKNDSLTVYVSEKMVLFTELANYNGGSLGLGSYNDAVYFDDVALRFSVNRDILAPEAPRGISLKLH